jgi:hypothetical protein
MARLDRLGAGAKGVAQIGAAIGREFSYELAAAVGELAEDGFQDALERLVEIGRAFRAALACLQPMLDSTLGLLGLGEVMRQQLGLAGDPIRKVRFEGSGDPGMQLSSRPAQQGAVCRILDQGVLEQVGGLGRRSALKDQAGIVRVGGATNTPGKP